MKLNQEAQLLGRGFYWQDLHVGEKFRTYRRTVTEADLVIEGMLCQTMVQGTGLALLEMSIKAFKPVVVNDAIHGVVEVVEVRPTSKNNRAVFASRVDVFNQEDVNVLTYDVKRMLAGRPD
jgi:acyl dehydratase